MTRTILGALAAAAFASSSIMAYAAQTSRLNDNAGIEPLSPGGTALGSATLWAVILPTGVTSRGDGNASSTRLSTGQYQVIFRRNLVNCAYVATIGNPGTGTQPPGEITVALRAGNNNGVFISTHDSAGNFSDRGFHLFVNC
ncbi:MAG: hypothetical protein KDK89_15135 [Alphaproteobacteria bacterium]|nr:hypothetical protein [Alphaproteobacteria bacterium]